MSGKRSSNLHANKTAEVDAFMAALKDQEIV